MLTARKLVRVALPMMGVIAMSMPVSAADCFAGVVDGQITGLAIQPVTQSAQSFNFVSTTLSGEVVGTDGDGPFASTAVASGGTAIIVNGQPTAGEDYAFGTGTVDNVNVAPVSGNSVGCTLSGKYARIGGVVVVTLTGSCTINGHTVRVTIAVDALFSPPAAELGAAITSATFVGPFVGEGA